MRRGHFGTICRLRPHGIRNPLSSLVSLVGWIKLTESVSETIMMTMMGPAVTQDATEQPSLQFYRHAANHAPGHASISAAKGQENMLLRF